VPVWLSSAVRKAWFGYVFDGGIIDDSAELTLQNTELDAVAFIDAGRVREMFTANTADRMEAALTARSNGGVAYLFNGQMVPAASSGHGVEEPRLGSGEDVGGFCLPRLGSGMTSMGRGGVLAEAFPQSPGTQLDGGVQGRLGGPAGSVDVP